MTKTSFVNTLAGRLMVFGVLPTMLAIGAIVATGAIDNYRELRDAGERLMAQSAGSAAAELSTRNDRWNNVAAVMALAQTNGMFGQRKASSDFVRDTDHEFPLVVGAFIAYEPDADGQDAAALKNSGVPREAMDAAGRFVPYWHSDSGAEALRPRIGMETMEFYLGPKNEFAKTGKGSPFVTEPFLKGGVLMVSHVFPIVAEGKFAGVAGVDRDFETLAGIARDIKSRLGADVFVLSAQDRFIAATTDGQDAAGETKGLRMQELAKSPYAPLATRWRAAHADNEAFEAPDPVLGQTCIYATSPVKIGGWNVVVRRTRADVMRAANAAVTRNIIIGGIGLAVIGGLMFFITRSASQRVRRAAEVADRIARGDLTQAIGESSSRDETGQLIRSMSTMDGNLNSLVGSVKQAGIHLNSTATEISATSKQQEASASTFGAASSQIAAAVKEISATGKDLVRTMASVSENAAETATLAGAGRTGLQGMESVMRDLDRATTFIGEKLGTINERSQKITTVITTITKVADQTNILSINAAIEAEKAGEFGAGFLVIAREIRRLADQTASATLDIEQMVQQMQAAVSSGVMEMDRFSDQVRRGVRDVASAGSQLTEIIDRVNRSTESFKQVNESMQAQSEGAQQISEAMTSLSSNAHQTMQSVQEFGRASTDLQSAIGVLRQAVAQFKLKE
jgi:methyl-accepting chemotaxis protein WspA